MRRLLRVLGLGLFLLFSVLSAVYVLFFRVAFAQEIKLDVEQRLSFEEPLLPDKEPVSAAYGNLSPPKALSLSRAESEGVHQKPKVAIIIDDLGYNKSIAKELFALPFVLNCSFLPFAPHTHHLERQAYDLGKTVLLHMPLEPYGKGVNPGPGVLLLTDSVADMLQKMTLCLAEVPHAVGVNNHMGSLFTESRGGMLVFMGELGKRGLFFVDSITSSASVGADVAQELGVAAVERDIFLDNQLQRQAICMQFERLVRIAKKTGSAIGIAHPHSMTAAALEMCARPHLEDVEYVSIQDLFKL